MGSFGVMQGQAIFLWAKRPAIRSIGNIYVNLEACRSADRLARAAFGEACAKYAMMTALAAVHAASLAIFSLGG